MELIICMLMSVPLTIFLLEELLILDKACWYLYEALFKHVKGNVNNYVIILIQGKAYHAYRLLILLNMSYTILKNKLKIKQNVFSTIFKI